MRALLQQDWVEMFAWLVVTVVIDGIDGTLARIARVKEVLPHFDGALLDNIVDYLTYVFVPAVYLYASGLMPREATLLGPALVVMSSAYQFSQSDAKTADYFFLGFPSYWNIVALYLFFLGMDPWANFAVVLVCAVLVFIPLKYAYPSRMTRYRGITNALTFVWGISLLVMLAWHPDFPPWLPKVSLLYVAYYLIVSFYLAYGPKPAQA